MEDGNWITKGTNTAFQDVLLEVHHVVWATEYFGGELPQSFFKHFERVKTNVTKKSPSHFVNKLREAVNGSDHKLWAEFEQPPRSSMYLQTFEVKGPKTSDLERTRVSNTAKVNRHKAGGSYGVPPLDGRESVGIAARVRTRRDVVEARKATTIKQGFEKLSVGFP